MSLIASIRTKDPSDRRLKISYFEFMKHLTQRCRGRFNDVLLRCDSQALHLTGGFRIASVKFSLEEKYQSSLQVTGTVCNDCLESEDYEFDAGGES